MQSHSYSAAMAYPFVDNSSIGVDLAGLLGGCMASAKGGSMPSGVGYGEECPPPAD